MKFLNGLKSRLKSKLKNKRGMTLIEVLLVVALMMVLLGIAMPDLISESRAIKLAGMNGNARAVAVAVQSKLYGMKNKGTVIGSEFERLNNAAGTTQVQTSDGGTDARYFANFGETAKTGKQILSGAITDSELLNGQIVVAYDPTTADIFEVFYAEDYAKVGFLPDELSESTDPSESPNPSEGTDPSESPNPSDKTEGTDLVLPNSNLFPTVSERYLTENMIGSYFGDPKPELTRKDGLPPFTAVWRYDDELYLELQMVQRSSASIEGLWNRNLGIEVYAEIPAEGNSRKTEEVLIYAEGMFGGNGVVMKNGEDTITIIAADYNDGTLTLNNILENEVENKKGILRFAFDSMVTTRAFWGGATSDLRHQSSPAVTTMRSEVLYPRESITNWFNKNVNPYLSYWEKFGDSAKNNSIVTLIDNNASATQFIDVNETFRLHIKMYVLDDKPNTEDPGSGEPETKTKDGFTATVYQPDDSIGVLDIRSPSISPYFYALSMARNKVTLSSVRDLNNLHYVFETENNIDTAELAGDIKAQQLYDKIVKVHKALDANGITKGNYSNWSYDSDQDAAQVDANYFKNKTKFTLSGTKPRGGGSYKIVSVTFGGRSPDLGGLFGYAENCTFKDLDIVNPKVLRNSSSRSVLGNNDNDKDNMSPNFNMSPNLGWGGVASGALAAIAVNCTFTNVRAYIDPGQTLKATSNRDTPQNEWGSVPITGYRVSGSVVGGLVGVAVGSSSVKTYYEASEEQEHQQWSWVTESTTGTSTTFTNCVASTILGPEYYYPPTECFVAGGLIGATVGDVQIKNSYASSQLSAYYAGGLVGAVGSVGTVSSVRDDGSTFPNSERNWIISANFPDHGIFKAGIATGKLTIKNSFAAGVIQHMVRVGGGLIAHISENAYSPKGVGDAELPVDVTDCYSAVRWRIVPPVAYGTFKDDKKNYYLYPTAFDLPVTANVVARFSTEHSNVFSLQDGNCGIACSETMLKNYLSEKDEHGGTVKDEHGGTVMKDGWGGVATSETTTTWKYLEFESGTDTAIKTPYPFPMPEGNTDFWGNWIQHYDTDGVSASENASENEPDKQILTGAKAKFTFVSYYATYYHNPWSMYPRNVDPGAITMRGITLKEDTIYIDGLPLGDDGATLTSYTTVDVPVYKDGEAVMVQKTDDNGNPVVGEDGEPVMVPKAVIKSYYWAQNAADENAVVIKKDAEKEAETATAKLNCGQGVDHGEVYGATKITPDPENTDTIDFASATYYKSSYKPLTGSNFHPGIKETNITRLMWDHYGFYLLLDFNPDDESGNTRYYITVGDDVAQGQCRTDSTTHNSGNMSYKDIYVNKTQFEDAIGYRTIRVSAAGATITWNSEYGLHVADVNGK